MVCITTSAFASLFFCFFFSHSCSIGDMGEGENSVVLHFSEMVCITISVVVFCFIILVLGGEGRMGERDIYPWSVDRRPWLGGEGGERVVVLVR